MSAEATPAVRRTADTLLIAEHGEHADLYLPDLDGARDALSAGLVIEEMARAIDPWAFRDHANNSAHMQDHCAARRNVATLAAQRIHAAIVGAA